MRGNSAHTGAMPNATVHPPVPMTTEECWSRLASAELGRLAVTAHDGVDIFPINFVVTGEVIYFRSAPGSKLVDLTANPRVAFEADGAIGHSRWSVVVRGEARRLDADDEIEASGILTLETRTGTDKDNFVRISAETITGVRVPLK